MRIFGLILEMVYKRLKSIGLTRLLGLVLVVCVLGVAVTFAVSSNWSFDPDLYEALLLTMQTEGYELLRYRDVLEGVNQTNRFVVLAHDVDGFGKGLHGVTTFEKIETKLGVRSTFFIRPGHSYFLKSIDLFESLEARGWEIGFHYNCLSIAKDMTRALRLFEGQVALLRAFYNISSMRPHGDIDNPEIHNGEIWLGHADFCRSLQVESYDDFDTYIYDTNRQLAIPSTEDWGSRILLNFHADWW